VDREVTMTGLAEKKEISYVSDSDGNTVGVIVPIELWREIESERETAYLLKSETMKRRLLKAKERQGGMSLEDARAELGV
jgi:PHD/YefM family antitoxin component YafN of YafNO toxin-antitoxin module